MIQAAGPSSAQAALFAAHDRLLSEAIAWLDSTQGPQTGIGNRYLMALGARILQLATAVQRLCEAGHAAEAQPTVRTMVSACVILSYLIDDRDGRAVAYRETYRTERKKRLARLEHEMTKATNAGKKFFVTPEWLAEYKRQDAELTSVEDKASATLAKDRIIATRLGPRTDTFTGLNNEWEFILPDNRFTVGGEWRHGPEIPYRLRAGAGSRGCATTRRREPGWPAFDLKQDAALKEIDARIGEALLEFARQTGRKIGPDRPT